MARVTGRAAPAEGHGAAMNKRILAKLHEQTSALGPSLSFFSNSKGIGSFFFKKKISPFLKNRGMRLVNRGEGIGGRAGGGGAGRARACGGGDGGSDTGRIARGTSAGRMRTRGENTERTDQDGGGAAERGLGRTRKARLGRRDSEGVSPERGLGKQRAETDRRDGSDRERRKEDGI